MVNKLAAIYKRSYGFMHANFIIDKLRSFTTLENYYDLDNFV